LTRQIPETYGTPVPTEVPLSIEKGPFIVISGHDLHDLNLLLEQTKKQGNPHLYPQRDASGHGYPKLKAYPLLKGHFEVLLGKYQQKEFDGIPARSFFYDKLPHAVKGSYYDRIFTTEVVAYPEMVHIDEEDGL
jgi:hydroxylamine reductase